MPFFDDPTGTRSLASALLLALTLGASAAAGQAENPPQPGFDLEGSDPQAIEIADAVMEAMGGRAAWDRTRYLTWSFFGRRTHVWDKHSGDLRYEDDERIVLMNLNTRKGRAWEKGSEITDPDALEKILYDTESRWINDSYWMFMPYKLKDTGVTLRYLGTSPMLDGRPADVLELTFREVGRTPENRYKVYVDQETRLVGQWDYFPEATDAEPRFQLPWRNWQRYGEILLSDDRGERRHEDIAVFDELPRSVFTSPEPVDWTKPTQ